MVVLRSVSSRTIGSAASGFLVAALLLGGGTRAGFFGDVVLQVAAVILLLMALRPLVNRQEPPLSLRAKRQIAVVLGAVPAIALLQLFPMSGASLSSDAAGSGSPISVSANATWVAALSVLPALALFVAVVQLPRAERRGIVVAALATGAISVLVGLLQVAQGPQSALRLYSFTNVTEAVGFFANRNHFSALLYVLLMFATAWAVNAAGVVGVTPWRRKFDRPVILPLALSVVLVAVFVAAQSYARSRAGLGLAIAALLGGALLSIGGSKQRRRAQKVLFGAALLGIMIATQFSLYRLLQRFEADPMEDARFQFYRNTLGLAQEYLPFGSGLGTFVPVYDTALRPLDALLDKFANRAHNDFLEGWLETGFLGVALAGVFLFWFVRRLAHVWTRSEFDSLDALICRAATISIVLLLMHSVVDYPLRTTALLCVFALCCALLVEPYPGAWAEPRQHKRHRPKSEPQVRKYFPQAAAPVARSLADQWWAVNSPSTAVDPPPKKAGPAAKSIGEWPSEWQSPRRPQDTEPHN